MQQKHDILHDGSHSPETGKVNKKQLKTDQPIDTHYRVVKKIGDGHFTEQANITRQRVYQVVDTRSGQNHCLKALTGVNQRNYRKFLKERGQFVETMRNEAKIHRTLDHPGIVKFISFNEAPSQLQLGKDETEIYEAQRVSHYILMEHAQSGDLFDFSIKLKQPMGEALGRHIFKQIVDSVYYLHNQAKIVHRDLKLENIVLDKNFQVKLCDFAMSKTIAEGSLTGVYYSQVGSERYMAPEIIEGRAYKGASVDVFALGVTLFALVTGVMPFDKRANKDSDVLYHLLYLNDDAAYWAHLNKVYDNESYFNKTLSDDFKKFITSFFKYNYYERVTIDQIKTNGWYCAADTNQELHRQELARRKSLLQ